MVRLSILIYAIAELEKTLDFKLAFGRAGPQFCLPWAWALSENEMLHFRQENLPASNDGTALFSSPAALDKLLKYLYEIVLTVTHYSTVRKNCHTL